MPVIFNPDPDQWLISLNRTIQDYLAAHLTPDAYEVVWGYPSADRLAKLMPFEKAIIHFEIDSLDARPIGFGESNTRLTYDPDTRTWTEEWAKCHRINYDVGIWTTDQTGGVTARWVIAQELDAAFHGAAAEFDFQDATGKVEILSWRGGGNEQDQINDVDVYRTIGAELIVECYSRVIPPPIVEVEEIIIEPDLSISGVPLEATGD